MDKMYVDIVDVGTCDSCEKNNAQLYLSLTPMWVNGSIELQEHRMCLTCTDMMSDSPLGLMDKFEG